MLGYESENEIIELGLYNMISKRCLPKIKNLYLKRSSGEIVSNIHNIELKRADGSMILIECIHYCMPFEGINLIITFYIGLTKIKSLEKKLRESEERYRILFENSPVGIGITNIEGNTYAMNKTMRELVGYTFEELNAIGLDNIYVDPSNRERMLKKLRKNDEVRDYEVQLKKKDGTEYIALLNIDIIELSGEEVLLTNVRDITERKKAEEKLSTSEKKFRNLFNNMSSGVAVYEAINDGQDFYFKDFNLAVEKIENITKEDLIGKSVLKIFPGIKEFGLFEIFQKVWRTGKPEHHPISQYKDERITGWRENYVYKLPSGEIVAVYDDITRQKQAEQNLKESEEKYREAYNLAELYKDLFAHDIGNILNNVKISVGLISMQENLEKIEDINEYLEIINNQMNRGNNLVKNIRRLSQLSETKAILTPFEVIKVMKNAAEFVKQSNPQKKVDIQIQTQDEKLYVMANEFLINVFENILFNAIIHNENQKIEIEIVFSKIKKNGNKYVKIEVKDNGIGIPDKIKEDLFVKKIEREKGGKKGMGLGLILVSKIISSYNSEIWVENRVKGDYTKGSNLIILLPEVA